MDVSVVLAVDSLDFVIGREAIAERTGIPDELGNSATPVKFRQYSDHSLALCLRLREAHRFLQFVIGNINRRLHASIVTCPRIQIKISWNLGGDGRRPCNEISPDLRSDRLSGDLRLPDIRCHVYLAGTSRLSSSSKCWTTTICGDVPFGSLPAPFIIRNRSPSA